MTHTSRPRVYCASPLSRAKMWRDGLILAAYSGTIAVVSTWHDNDWIIEADNDPTVCATEWETNFKQIRQSDALLAYAEHKDRPNGTLVEIGYALAQELPVFLVGNFQWGSWRFHPAVAHLPTLREAFTAITGVHSDVQT